MGNGATGIQTSTLSWDVGVPSSDLTHCAERLPHLFNLHYEVTVKIFKTKEKDIDWSEINEYKRNKANI